MLCFCWVTVIYEGYSLRGIFLKTAKYIFFQNFFYKYKQNYLELVYSKNYFNLAEILGEGYTKWWPIKQSAPVLNTNLSSNVCCLRNANLMKFTEECMCMEKHVLVIKKKRQFW